MATKQSKKENSSKEKSDTSSKTKNPQTMDDLLSMYGSGVASLKRGDRVDGTVAEITPKRIVVAFGGKSEGIVAEKAYQEAREYIKTLQVGDSVRPSVIVPEAKDGTIILSLRHAAYDSAWAKVEKAYKDQKPLTVAGRSLNQSGLMVEFDNLTGFVPLSQFSKEAAKNPQSLIQKHFKALPIQVNREENKIVLSERAVTDAEDIKQIESAMKQLKVGEIYEGEVISITTFGCFVSIPVKVSKKEMINVEGLVHISELSWGKVASAKEVVSEGDLVKVAVLGVDFEKVSLSIKHAQKDPWADIDKKYQKDTKVTGTVSKLTDYGLFVVLEEGIEGLVHLTKIPPGTKYETGDSIQVYVEEIEPKEKRISLGLVLTTKPVGYR